MAYGSLNLVADYSMVEYRGPRSNSALGGRFELEMRGDPYVTQGPGPTLPTRSAVMDGGNWLEAINNRASNPKALFPHQLYLVDFHVGAWFCPTELDGFRVICGVWDSANVQRGWMLGLDPAGKLSFKGSFSGTSVDVNVVSTKTANTREWNYAEIQHNREAATWDLQLNHSSPVRVTSAPDTYLNPSNAPFTVGAWGTDGTRNWKGMIGPLTIARQ